jgi:hypothetical protein
LEKRLFEEKLTDATNKISTLQNQLIKETADMHKKEEQSTPLELEDKLRQAFLIQLEEKDREMKLQIELHQKQMLQKLEEIEKTSIGKMASNHSSDTTHDAAELSVDNKTPVAILVMVNNSQKF